MRKHKKHAPQEFHSIQSQAVSHSTSEIVASKEPFVASQKVKSVRSKYRVQFSNEKSLQLTKGQYKRFNRSVVPITSQQLMSQFATAKSLLNHTYETQFLSKPQSHHSKPTKPRNFKSLQKIISASQSQKRDRRPSEFIETMSANKVKRKCIFESQSKCIKLWDFFVLLMLVWKFGVMIIVLGLSIVNVYFSILSSMIIDLFMVLDLLVSFRLTYLDKQGDEVYAPKKIALKYIKSFAFYIDLLSSVPFEFIYLGSEIGQMLGVIKLIKLKKVMKLIRKLNFHSKTKRIIKLFVSIIFLIIFTLCISTFFLQAIYIDCQWFPIIQQINSNAPQNYNFCNDRTNIERFFLSVVYTNIMVISEGQGLPQNSWQLSYASLLLLIGSFLDAIIFGIVVTYIQLINEKENLLNRRFDNMRTTMKDLKLPRAFQRQMLHFTMGISFTHLQHQELHKFLELLSPSLNAIVTKQICESALKACPPLFNIKDQENLGYKLTLIDKMPEDRIFNYKDTPDGVYFVLRGEIQISRPRFNHQGMRHQKYLPPGSYFGEIGCFLNIPRTLRVTNSMRYTLLGFLKQEDLVNYARQYPQLKQQLVEKIKSYKDKTNSKILKAIQQAGILPSDVLASLNFELFKFTI